MHDVVDEDTPTSQLDGKIRKIQLQQPITVTTGISRILRRGFHVFAKPVHPVIGVFDNSVEGKNRAIGLAPTIHARLFATGSIREHHEAVSEQSRIQSFMSAAPGGRGGIQFSVTSNDYCLHEILRVRADRPALLCTPLANATNEASAAEKSCMDAESTRCEIAQTKPPAKTAEIRGRARVRI